MPAPMVTPCINVCQLDLATGLCTGCARTRDEVARWISLTDAERDAVMRELPSRKARLSPAD